MVCYLGHIIHHDDSTTDRSEGSQRNHDKTETKRIWFEKYEENMAIPGDSVSLQFLMKNSEILDQKF